MRKLLTLGVLGLIGVIAVWSSYYTVEEGHVGIVKTWSKATSQVSPGLHFKFPFAQTVEYIEVRQRKNVEKLAAATANQLAIQTVVSINWTVKQESAMDLFVNYGGLDQFETRLLDPKLRSAAKAALSQYRADELIRDRQRAVASIMVNMTKALEGLPVTVNSPQIEDIAFPPVYADAVTAKEEAREQAEKEKHKLERQRLVALQAVNTAEASAKSKRLAADAEAYRVTTEATAEANAIDMINEQLANSPRYIELIKAKAWNGELPRTMLGENTSILFTPPTEKR